MRSELSALRLLDDAVEVRVQVGILRRVELALKGRKLLVAEVVADSVVASGVGVSPVCASAVGMSPSAESASQRSATAATVRLNAVSLLTCFRRCMFKAEFSFNR